MRGHDTYYRFITKGYRIMSQHLTIKMIALDVDGVMSPGQLYYTDSGVEVKAFNTQDGLGLTIAKALGIKLAIITGRYSEIVRRRGKELKFDHIIMGNHNKSEALKKLCQEAGISLDDVAYMGDDLNDLGVMSIVGLPMTPANGRPENKEIAKYITEASGGAGAIREAVEYILKSMGEWDKAVAVFASESYSQTSNGQ